MSEDVHSVPKGGVMGGRQVRDAVLVLTLTVFCRSLAMLPVFRQHLQQYLSVDDRGFGMLFSIGTLAGLVAVLGGGVVVDRQGPRAVLRLGFGGTGLALLILALAGSSWGWVASALALAGLFAGPLAVAANAFFVQLLPTHKRRVLSLNLMASSGGEMLFPPLAEGLLALTQRSQQLTFGAVFHVPYALLGALLLAGSRLLSRTESPVTPLPRGRPSLLLRRTALALVLLAALHGAADTVLYIYMPRFLDSAAFAKRSILPGFFLAGYSLAYLVSRGLLALLPEALWRRRLMVLPGLLGGAVMIGAILSRDYLITGWGYVLAAFLWSAEFPTFVARVAEEDGQRFGSASALLHLVCAGMAAAGLAGVGWLVSAVGEDAMWRVMLLPAAVFPCIGTGGGIWVLATRSGQPLRRKGGTVQEAPDTDA